MDESGSKPAGKAARPKPGEVRVRMLAEEASNSLAERGAVERLVQGRRSSAPREWADGAYSIPKSNPLRWWCPKRSRRKLPVVVSSAEVRL